jgi:hypothetical protein
MTSDLDEMLRAYLQAQRDNPVQDTLKRIADAQIAHEQLDIVRHGELVAGLNGHNFRLSSLESRADKFEEHEEITGQHQLESLRAANKRWSDGAWYVIRLVVVCLLGGGVVEIVHRLAAK